MTTGPIYSQRLVEGLVRDYTRRNQTATVIIVRVDEPTRTPGDLTSYPPEAVVYQGRGRVYNVSGPVQYMLGEEQQYFSSTYVSVPDTDTDGAVVRPRTGDLIQVLAHHDEKMVGRVLRATDVQAGGQFKPFIVMLTTGAQDSRTWDHPSNVSDLTIPDEWIVE